MKKLSIVLLLTLSLSACEGASINDEEAATILRESLSKFLESESYSFEIDFSVKQNDSYLEINSTGSNDFSDPEKLQSSYESTIKNSKLQGETGFTIKLSVIKIGEDTYLKIAEAPDLNANLLGNWQNVSAKRLQDFFKLGTESTEEDLYKATFAGDLNAETRAQLAAYLKEHDLFQITRVYPDNLLNGIPIYQLSAELQVPALKEYLIETARLQGTTLTEELLNKLDDSLQHLYIMLELYLGRDDHKIYKVTGNLEYQDEQQSLESIYKITLNNYGKKLDLKAPEDATDFLETPELTDFEEDLDKMNSKACKDAMEKAQSLSSESSPEAIALLSQNLREACQ